MRLLTIYRQAIQRLAMKRLGQNMSSERVYAAQLLTNHHQFEFFKLPIKVGASPIRDTDPDSPTFGAPYFVVGISAVGGTDIVA